MKNVRRKWYHGLVENTLDGMQYIFGESAINEDMALRLVHADCDKYFGDESMFVVFRGWLTDAEADASGLDEF